MTAVESYRPSSVDVWDTTQKQIIKEQIAKDCSDGELRLFAQVCAKTGLDPFSRQIYAIKRSGKMSIQTSIDGFRVIAERSRDYEGQTPKQWCDEDGVWVDVWLKKDHPAAARVGVWRRGFREPLYAVATWAEYAQTSPMWSKMGPHMLAKCAESLALRAAFPNDLSGLYTSDELPDEPAPSRGRPVRSTGNDEQGAIPSPPSQQRSSALNAGEDARPQPQAASASSPVEIVTTSPPTSARRTFAPPKKAEADEVEPMTLREAQQTATRMRQEATKEAPAPVEGVQPALMTALRDTLTRITNDSVRKELVAKWSEAGLPNVKAPNVTLTEAQYEVALVLAQDAEESQAELEKPFDEPTLLDEDGAA